MKILCDGCICYHLGASEWDFRVIIVLAEHIWCESMYVVCIGIVVGMDVGDLTF